MAINLLAQHVPARHRQPTRQERVARLVRAAAALRDGEPVDRETGEWIGRALLAWATAGGNFAQRLKLSQRGSHLNVQRLAARAIESLSSLDEEQAHKTRDHSGEHEEN